MAVNKSKENEIQIPLGWKRSSGKDGDSGASLVTYISPNGTVLSSIAEVCKYLESDDTCKCGLECPLYVSKVFNFNPQVKSIKSWRSEPNSDERTVKLNKKCGVHQKELEKKYIDHRKKKRSKSLQKEPEPPPKLIIRRKGGQLTSVISDKADKKTAVSHALISPTVYSTAVASTIIGSPALQTTSLEKSIKSKNDFKLQWIKVDDEVSHTDHDSGNELRLSPVFKHSPPPIMMSSPSYSHSLHGHPSASVMTFPNQQDFASFNQIQSGFYKPNFHVKNEPGFRGSAMVCFPKNTAGPVSNYPGIIANAEHKQPAGQLPVSPNFYLPGMNAMSDMPMHAPHSNNPWSQQIHPAGMQQGFAKNKPAIPWQMESGRLPQNVYMTSPNSHQNRLASPYDINTMVRPGSKTPCQVSGQQQYPLNSPPPCNPTSPFAYQPRQCVIGASPSNRTNPSPFSNHSHSRPSSIGTPKPAASPLPAGQWPNSRTNDSSRSNNPTTPIPSASPLSRPPWRGNIPFSVKSSEISSASGISYSQRIHPPQERSNMQCNIRQKMDMSQTENFPGQSQNTQRFFSPTFNILDQWPVPSHFPTNPSTSTISRPQLPLGTLAGHPRTPVGRNAIFGASPSVVYNDMPNKNSQFCPQSNFPGGRFPSRVPLQQQHRAPWTSGPLNFGQKVTPMVHPHSSYSHNLRFSMEMQTESVTKPPKRRRRRKAKAPTTSKEQQLSATSPVLMFFPEMFHKASNKVRVSSKTAASQINRTVTTSLTATSSILSTSAHDISSCSDRLGFPGSSLALSPTFEIPPEIFQSSTFSEVQTSTVSKSPPTVESSTSSAEPTLLSPQETGVVDNIAVDHKEDTELYNLPVSSVEQKTMEDSDRPVTTPPLPLLSPTHSLGDEGNDDFSDVPVGFDFHDSPFSLNAVTNSPCAILYKPTSAVTSDPINTPMENSLPELIDQPEEKCVCVSGSTVDSSTTHPSKNASFIETSLSDSPGITESRNSVVTSNSFVSAISSVDHALSLTPSVSSSMTAKTKLVTSSGKIFQVPSPFLSISPMKGICEVNPLRYGASRVKRRWSDPNQLSTNSSKCFSLYESKRRLSDSYAFTCKKQCLDISSQVVYSEVNTENHDEGSKTSVMYSNSAGLCSSHAETGTLSKLVAQSNPVQLTSACRTQTVNATTCSSSLRDEPLNDNVLPLSSALANVPSIETVEPTSKGMVEMESASVSVYSESTVPDLVNMTCNVPSRMEVSSCQLIAFSEAVVTKSNYICQGGISKLSPEGQVEVTNQERLEKLELKMNLTEDRTENPATLTPTSSSCDKASPIETDHLDEKDNCPCGSLTLDNQENKDNQYLLHTKENIKSSAITPGEVNSTEQLNLVEITRNPKSDVVNNNISESRHKVFTAIAERHTHQTPKKNEEKSVPSSDLTTDQVFYGASAELKTSLSPVTDKDSLASSVKIHSPVTAETDSENDVIPSSLAGVAGSASEEKKQSDVKTYLVLEPPANDQELKPSNDVCINKTEEFSEQDTAELMTSEIKPSNDKDMVKREGEDVELETEDDSNRNQNPVSDELVTRSSSNSNCMEESIEVSNLLEPPFQTSEQELDNSKDNADNHIKENIYDDTVTISPIESDKMPKDIDLIDNCPTDKDTESEIRVEQPVPESFHDDNAEKQLQKNALGEDLRAARNVLSALSSPASASEEDTDKSDVTPSIEVEISPDISRNSDSLLPYFESKQDPSCSSKDRVSIIEKKQDADCEKLSKHIEISGNATDLAITSKPAIEDCHVLSTELEDGNPHSKSYSHQPQSLEVEDKLLDISVADQIESEAVHENLACGDVVTEGAFAIESRQAFTNIVVNNENNDERVDAAIEDLLLTEEKEVVHLTDMTSCSESPNEKCTSAPSPTNNHSEQLILSETSVENKDEGMGIDKHPVSEIIVNCTQEQKGSIVNSAAPENTTAPSVAIPQELTHTVIRQLSTYNTLLKNLLVSSVGPNSAILSELGDGTGQPTEQQMKMLSAVANPVQPYLVTQASSVSPAMLLYQNPVFRRACTRPDCSASTSNATSSNSAERLSSSTGEGKQANLSSATERLSNTLPGCEEKKKASPEKISAISHHRSSEDIPSRPPQEKTTTHRRNSEGTDTGLKPLNPTTVDSPQMPSTSMLHIDSDVPGPSRGVPKVIHDKSMLGRRCHSVTQGLQVPIVSSSDIGTHGAEGDEDRVHGKHDEYDAMMPLHNEVSTSQPSHDVSPSVENILEEKRIPDRGVASKCSTVGSSTEPMQRKKRGRPRCSPRQNPKRGLTELPDKTVPPKRAAAIASASMLANLRQRPATLVDKVVHKSFKNGDLVWGQMRGFPSWPGKIVRASEVRGIQQRAPLPDGKVWVKWFGDHTFAQMNPTDLRTMTEGLELHHKSRKKGRTRNRKISIHLETAIQEAVDELEQQQKALAAKKSAISASTSLSVNQTETDETEKVKPRRGRKRKVV